MTLAELVGATPEEVDAFFAWLERGNADPEELAALFTWLEMQEK